LRNEYDYDSTANMLLDEDPAAVRPPNTTRALSTTQRTTTQHSTLTTPQLISQCTSHFKIANDTASLLRINDSLSTLSQFRSQHLQSLKSSLSQLSRTHQTLSANHSHTLSQHNPTNHAAEILKLDTEKFKIAKQASDLEIEGERLQQERERLAGVAADLEAEGVEGGEREKAESEDATM
jgi:kinetochore protein Spc24